jgi:hypothetical protein
LTFIIHNNQPQVIAYIKGFCATTKFDAQAAHGSGFQAPYTLGEGLVRTLKYEFLHPQPDSITFMSE